MTERSKAVTRGLAVSRACRRNATAPLLGALLALAASLVVSSCKGVPLTAASGSELSMAANPTSISVQGGVSTITVTAFKASGDGGGPVSDGTQIFFTTDLGVIEERVETQDGIARASLRSDGRSGTATVNARSGSGIAAEPVTIEIGLSGEGIAITVTANPATLGPFDVTSEITANVTDANGNPIANAPVIFSTDAGSLASAGSVLRTNQSGQAFDRLTLLDTAASATVTVTSGASAGTVTVTRGSFADPIVDSVSPFSGGRGQSLTVTLTGQHFRVGATVSFGVGIDVNDVTFVNSETLRASIRIDPLATTGERTVTVTNTDGTTASLTDGFLVTSTPGGGGGTVTVASVSPPDANQGSTVNVNISGTGFAAGAVASFGAGVGVNSVTFISSSQLQANISVSGAAAAGPRDVTVTNPDASSDTLTGGFTVVAPPIVSAVTPTNGNPGDVIVAVEINGNNFQSGATVDFGAGITVTMVLFVDPTTLFVDITISAAAVSGARTVTVTNPDGGSGSLAAGFTVN